MSFKINFNEQMLIQRLEKGRPMCFGQWEELDDNLFAHIHFDHRITGTHLEGNYFKNTTACVKKMLNHLTSENHYSFPKETHERIKAALLKVEKQFDSLTEMEAILEKFKNEMLEVVKKGKKDSVEINKENSLHPIKDGEEIEKNYILPVASAARKKLEEFGEVSIPGGWVSEVGSHAMCYQFIRETEGPNKGSYTFLVYNTGDGIQYHQESTALHEKRTPIMAYRIPATNNSLNNIEDYMKELIAPRIKPFCLDVNDIEPTDWKLERMYDAKRLYTEIIPKIFALGATPIDLKKKVNRTQYTPITTMGQLGGSCSMRVLMPLLHVALKGEAFQQFLYQFRLQTIVDYYRLQQKIGKLHTPKVQRTLRKAIKGLGKTIHKMMHRKKNGKLVLTEAQVNEGLAWADLIGQELDIAQSKLLSQNQTSAKELKEKREFSLTSLQDDNLLAPQKSKKETEEAQRKPEKTGGAEIKEGHDLQKKKMPESDIGIDKPNPLQYLKNCYETLSINDKLDLTESVINETEKMFLGFPLDFEKANHYWKHLESKEAKEALTYLQLIQRIYGKHCGKAGGYPLARQTITSETARLNAVFILNRAFQENNKLARLSDSAIENIAILNDVENVSFDPRFDKRIAELEQFKKALVVHNNKFERNHKSDEDYFDLNFLESHVSESDRKKLEEQRATRECSPLDRARLNLYRSRYSYDPGIKALHKEYDIFLQFKQFSGECSLFKEAHFDYFAKANLSSDNSANEADMDLRYRAMDTREVTEQITKGYYTTTVPAFRRSGDYVTGYFFNNYKAPELGATKITLPQFLNIDNTYVQQTLFDSTKNSNQRIIDSLSRAAYFGVYSVKSKKGIPVPLPKRSLPFTRQLNNEGRVITTNDFVAGLIEIFHDQNYANFALVNYFTPHLLMKQTTRNPDFSLSLVKTIEEGLSFYTREKELLEGGLFFLSLSYYVLKYLKVHPNAAKMQEAIEKLEALDKVIKEHINYYETQLKNPNSSKTKEELERNLATLYTIYSLRKGLTQDKKMTDEELMILLKSQLTTRKLSEIGEDRILSSLQTRNLDEMMSVLQLNLNQREVPVQEKMLKNAVLDVYSDYIPKENCAFSIHFPVIIITHPELEEPIKIDIIRGTFSSASTRRGKVPFEIQNNDQFTSVFGKKSREVLISNKDNNTICTFIEQPDPKNPAREYKVIFKPQRYEKWEYQPAELTIYTRLGKERDWYQYVKKPDFTLPPRFKQNEWRVFESRDKNDISTYYFLDNKGNTKCRIEPRKQATGIDKAKGPISYQIIELNEGVETGYTLITDKKQANSSIINAIYSQLTRFEKRENIEIWQSQDPKSGEIKLKLRLPRYNLEWESKQNANKQLELVWTKDPNYHLILTDRNIIPGFEHQLLMENIKGMMISLIPKQEYGVIDKEVQDIKTEQEVKAEDEYYKLYYNLEGNLETGYQENREKYYQYQIVQNPPEVFKLSKQALQETSNYTLKGNTTSHLLHLVYLYLANHNTTEALEILKKCRKIKGTPEEVELIRRIMTQIPSAHLSSKGMYAKARIQDPETCTIRLMVSDLLARQKQTSFNTLQDIDERSPASSELLEFYFTGFEKVAKENYRQYYSRMESIASAIRMPERDESLFLETLYPEKDNTNTPLFVLNRKKLLNLRQLSDRKKELLQKRDKEDLNSKEALELKSLEGVLANSMPLQKKSGRWRLNRAQLILPPIEMPSENTGLYSYTPRGYLALLDQPQLYETRTEPPQRFTSVYLYQYRRNYSRKQNEPAFMSQSHAETVIINPITLDSLDYCRPEDFIYAFKDIYKYCLPPIKAPTDPILLKIKSVVESALRSGFATKNMKDKEKIQFSLCQILAYMLKNPNKGWPAEFKISAMPDIRLICTAMFDESPPTIGNYQMLSSNKLISSQIVSLSEVHREVKRKAEARSSTPVMPLNVISELSLDAFIVELDKLEQHFDLETEKSKAELNVLPNQDPFIERQKTKHEWDLQMGKRKNKLRDEQRTIYKKYLLNKSHEDFKNLLKTELDNNQSLLQSALEKLLKTANQALTGNRATPESTARVLREELKELTLNHLIGFYLQGDRERLMKETLLTVEEVDSLYLQIHEYLVNATENQHRSRIISTLNNLIGNKNRDSDEYQSDINKLGEQLSQRRSYDPKTHPEMLVFEFFDEKRIRKDQYRLMGKLLEKNNDGLFNNEIVQMIMGGGKSKILLPLLALRKSDGSNLSIIVVPDALFETNFSDLSSVTEQVFGKTAHRLLFNRDSHRTAEDLRLLRKRLEYIVSNQEYLVTTAESVQSLELKYLEILNKEILSEDETQQVEELEKILHLIKNKGDALVDECDTVLDPKRELNYTQGEKSSIEPYILDNILKIYHLLNKATVELRPGEFCSLEDLMMGRKILTKESDRDQALQKLAAVLMNDSESPLTSIVKLIPENERKLFFKYLINDKEVQEIPKSVMERNPDHKKLIGLAKGEIKLFKTTLRRKFKEHYGFPLSEKYPGSYEIAIPYLSSNTPNEKAQFGSIYEIINYTIQAQKQKDLLTLELIKKFIYEYKSAAQNELLVKKGRVSLDNTVNGKEFFELTGISLNSISLEDSKKLSECQLQFSHTPKVHDAILLKYVLPEIKQYKAILRSNPINHASQYRTCQGFTGTAWNVDCYHHLFNFDETLSLGIDGQTIDLLMQKLKAMHEKGQQPIRTCPEGSLDLMIRTLVNDHPMTHDVHAIIDVGGLFKTAKSNFDVASSIALQIGSRPKNAIRHVLFFNEKNELCAIPVQNPISSEVIFIGTSLPEVIFEKTGSAPHQCFTYYSQRHTTGTDIKQAPNAIGITTVDMDTKARDLWQGIMRLREFPNQQKIEIALSKAAQSTKPQNHDWNAEDIIALVRSNQDEVLGDFYLSTALDNMDSILRRYCLDKISTTETLAQKLELRNVFSKVVDTHLQEDPFIKYGSLELEKKTEEIVSKHYKDCLQLFDEITKEAKIDVVGDRTRIERDLANIQLKALKICKKQYLGTATDQGRMAEVDTKREREADARKEAERTKELEKAKEKEKEKEREREREQERILREGEAQVESNPIIPWGEVFPTQLKKGKYPLKSGKSIEIVTLNDMIKTAVPGLAWQFADNILVSENYLNVYQSQNNKLDAFIKPLNYFLVVKNPESNTLQSMLIAAEEAQEFVEFFDHHTEELKKSGFEAMVLTPNNEPWASTSNSSNLRNHPQFSDILEQIRFFNGDINFLMQDQQYNWIYEQEDSKLHFLENYVLPNHNKSPLAQVYRQNFKEYRELCRQPVSESRKLLFESLKSKNTKTIDEAIEGFKSAVNNIQVLTIKNSLMNLELVELVLDAIKFGDPTLLKAIRNNSFLYGNGERFQNAAALQTALQFYQPDQPEVFNILLSDQAFWPKKEDVLGFQTLLQTVFSSNNPTIISKFLQQASQYYGIAHVESSILAVLDLIKKKPKESATLLKLIGQVVEKPDLKLWSEYFYKISSSDPDKTFRILEAWDKDPENVFLKSFRIGKWSAQPSLLSSIATDPLFLKLLFNPRFTIPPQDLDSWMSLIQACQFREDILLPILEYIKKTFSKDEWQRFLDHPKMLHTFDRFFHFENDIEKSPRFPEKGRYTWVENVLRIFLKDYPALNNEKAWQALFKYYGGASRNRLGNELVSKIDKIVETAFGQPLLTQFPYLARGIIENYIQRMKLITLERHLSSLDLKDPTQKELAVFSLNTAIKENAWPLVLSLWKRGLRVTDKAAFESLINWAITNDKSLFNELLSGDISDLSPEIAKKIYEETLKNPALLQPFLRLKNSHEILKANIQKYTSINNVTTMKLILKHFGDPNYEKYSGDVFEYCMQQVDSENLASLKVFFDLGLIYDFWTYKFLELAFNKGRINSGKYLLSLYKFDDGYYLKKSGISLSAAIKKGDKAWFELIFSLLKTVNMDIDLEDFHQAVLLKNSEIIKLLIEKYPIAANQELFSLMKLDDLKSIKLLLDNGCSPNGYFSAQELLSEEWGSKRTVERSPLFTAVLNKQANIVSLLLESGADPKIPCRDFLEDFNILTFAVSKGDENTLTALLKYPNEKFDQSDLRKAKWIALNRGSLEMVKALINRSESTVQDLIIAISKGYTGIVKQMMEVKVLAEALQAEKAKELKLALDLRVPNPAEQNNLALFMANLGASWGEQEFFQAVQNAIHTNQYDVLEAMLQHIPSEFSINAKNANGKTAYNMATELNDKTLASILLKAGADPNIAFVPVVAANSHWQQFTGFEYDESDFILPAEEVRPETIETNRSPETIEWGPIEQYPPEEDDLIIEKSVHPVEEAGRPVEEPGRPKEKETHPIVETKKQADSADVADIQDEHEETAISEKPLESAEKPAESASPHPKPLRFSVSTEVQNSPRTPKSQEPPKSPKTPKSPKSS